MTASRDPDQLIRRFVLEGEEELNDQIYDAVRAVIDHKRQRVFIGPWRTPTMNKIVGFGLAAAAVVAVVLIGSRFVGSTSGGGVGDQPSASASVEATPRATSSPYALSLVGEPITVRAAVPESGWTPEPGGGVISSVLDVDAPDGAGIITFVENEGYRVYGDPCQWSTTMPDAPATTVDELVAALSAQASRDASAAVDITLDGHAGKSITLHVPDDADFAACDEATFASWGTRDEDPSRYHQDPGQIDKLWIVDVDGHLVVIDMAYYPGTPRDVVDELDAIVESVTFE